MNTAFLTMAIAHGLTIGYCKSIAGIIDECRICVLICFFAREESDIRYIERMNMLAEKYAGQERVLVPVKKRRRMIRQTWITGRKKCYF